jgi:hypothetical protein
VTFWSVPMVWRKYHNGSFTEVYTGLATPARGGPVTGSERFKEALRTVGGGSPDIGTVAFAECRYPVPGSDSAERGIECRLFRALIDVT